MSDISEHKPENGLSFRLGKQNHFDLYQHITDQMIEMLWGLSHLASTLKTKEADAQKAIWKARQTVTTRIERRAILFR